MAYHRFKNDQGDKYGSFEVFYHEGGCDLMPDCVAHEKGVEPLKPGWYWWCCFPGCLPDSDPIGPFTTESQAHNNAIEEWS
jgi:hypothetical protein